MFAWQGNVFIKEDTITVQDETRKGKVVRKQTLDRTEVVIHAESLPSTGR